MNKIPAIAEEVCIAWFRRDLRLDDNAALSHALESGKPVVALFIFDTDILDKLDDKNDRRVAFIHNSLKCINERLLKLGSSLLVMYGKPIDIFRKLTSKLKIKEVYVNHDYEPYARKRDEEISRLLAASGIVFHTFCDQVIFEKNDVLKPDQTPYTVFTPYMKRWRERLQSVPLQFDTSKHLKKFIKIDPLPFPSLEDIGFHATDNNIPEPILHTGMLINYEQTRNIPSLDATSRIGVHLRFGTISIRKAVSKALAHSETFLNELIWREFFMMILWHSPHTATQCFKPAYENIKWRNNESDFEKWCKGETGYPLVDAGMRELNNTGFMHNRVRMVVASFLCKHLLIDWRWGEAYFASNLLDYEMSSNVGNWQWAAGCGCDAAPYFRIFNPTEQAKKFDPSGKYIRRWIPEYDTLKYPQPMIDHAFARERALRTYKEALGNS